MSKRTTANRRTSGIGTELTIRSQCEVAALLGVTQQAVAKLEKSALAKLKDRLQRRLKNEYAPI